MNWQRKVGVSLVVAGALLFGVYLVPTVYGVAMSHLAIAQFRAQSNSNRLWNSARIRAYKRTLNISFAPPEAILHVRRLGIEVPVFEGVSDAALNRGAGHIAGTALPGEPGNLAITGHRDGFFRPLKDIRPGDILEVQHPAKYAVDTADSSAPAIQQTDRYVVDHIQVVAPSDTSVLKRTPDSTLTLIACYPFYFIGAAPQRFVVQASLLPALPATAMQTNTASAKPGFAQPSSGE